MKHLTCGFGVRWCVRADAMSMIKRFVGVLEATLRADVTLNATVIHERLFAERLRRQLPAHQDVGRCAVTSDRRRVGRG